MILMRQKSNGLFFCPPGTIDDNLKDDLLKFTDGVFSRAEGRFIRDLACLEALPWRCRSS